MRSLARIVALGLALVVPVAAGAQDGRPLYRVFLSDGTALVSFGEWARVGDRLVFSMPLTPGAGPSDLHLVSLPVARVDLARSERYAEAVRAANYAATQGESDFAKLSSDVADVLNRVALIADPTARLSAAEEARRALTEWPGAALRVSRRRGPRDCRRARRRDFRASRRCGSGRRAVRLVPVRDDRHGARNLTRRSGSDGRGRPVAGGVGGRRFSGGEGLAPAVRSRAPRSRRELAAAIFCRQGARRRTGRNR